MNLLDLGLRQGANAFNAEDEGLRAVARNDLLNQQLREAQQEALGTGAGMIAGYELESRKGGGESAAHAPAANAASMSETYIPPANNASAGTVTLNENAPSGASASSALPGTSRLTGRVLHYLNSLNMPWEFREGG